MAIAGSINAINWANIFYCQLTTSSSIAQADLDTWLNSFQAAYKTNFAPVQHPSTLYGTATATLYVPGGSVLQSTVVMTGAGTEGGTVLPDNSSCRVVSWLSSVYWRGGKPRTYLPGVISGDVTNNNQLVAGAITTLKAAAAAFRTAINALNTGTITGTALGFVSFTSGNAPRGTPLFFAVTGATVHPRLGTQRRRLGKWRA